MAIDRTRIVKTVGKLRKLLKTDSTLLTPEEVHDLRTRTRRFEASTKAMQVCEGSKEQRLLRRLRKIRKRAGRVRDMDVFTSYLLGLQFDDHRNCAIRLVEHLGAERHRLAKELRKAIAKHGSQARQELKKSSACVENLRRPDVQSGSRRAAAGTALNLSAELASTAIRLVGVRTKQQALTPLSTHGDTSIIAVDASLSNDSIAFVYRLYQPAASKFEIWTLVLPH